MDAAWSRNGRLHVTGALIATDTRFAQVLEGSHAAIGELMDSIHRDRRHTQIEVVQDGVAMKRQFSDWSLAYSGYSAFAEGLIDALSTQGSPEPERRHVQRLVAFMRAFAQAYP